MYKKIIFLCLLFFGTSTAVGELSAHTGTAASLPAQPVSRVNLVWQPTFEAENNLSALPVQPGVNTASPCWFSIVNEAGLIKSDVDETYIAAAKARGYRLWPLIDSGFDADRMHELLNNDTARHYVVQQLLFYTERYGFDGINLDFENIYDEDRDQLTLFVREITMALRAEGKTVSIDVTVPSTTPNWSPCYDREALAQIVDYVMLMAYDEHWRTSPVSGSVASLGWVENGIIATMQQQVPPEKLVLGIPLYMRLWTECQGKVSARTLTMPAAQALIKEKGLSPQWQADQGQYYFEYNEAGRRYRVWQEDERSLASKVALVKKYNLAGIASWRKGFESPEVWPVLAAGMAE